MNARLFRSSPVSQRWAELLSTITTFRGLWILVLFHDIKVILRGTDSFFCDCKYANAAIPMSDCVFF